MSDPLELLRRGLGELGSEVGPDAVERLGAFATLLARWAPRINLTGHRDVEAIAKLLLLDAAALWQALPRVRSVVDLGSGAGVPGLPIAILAPQVGVLLVEARLRRHHFQKAARRELGLENVALRLGRMEELEPEPADLVVAQAVAPPATVLGWMIPWARGGGWLAIPGAEQAPDPLARGDGPAGQVEDARVLSYRVPLSARQRSVWLARRKDS
jgi:16S rRNA (guanine527-N7)-methyltransferase